MKTKILLSALFLLVVIISARPQCTVNPFYVHPDSMYKGAMSPKEIHLCVSDMPTDPTIQILPMFKYFYGGTYFDVDSFTLNSMAGFPSWMDYICLDAECKFRAGVWTCMAIPLIALVPNVLGTDTVKLYELVLNLTVWARAGGTPVTMSVTPDEHIKIWVHPAHSYPWWDNTVNNFYKNISGKVFFDINRNGVKDLSEPYIQNQKVLLLPDSIIAYTNNNGKYSFNVDSGNYTVRYVPQGIWMLSSANSSYSITVDTANVTIPDFGVRADDTSNITVTLSSGISRCNSTTPYWINYKNEGTRTENGLISFKPDHITSFLDDYPQHDSISNGCYFWHFDNFLPGEERQIYIYLTMPGLANTGDSLVTYSFLRTANILRSDTLRQIFVCSYDPNDKTVYPFGKGPEKYTLMNETLRYTIRFQNTGNDTAFNITVKDTLSPYLDLNSFKLLASNHPVNVNLKTGGAMLFRFDNIMLPDSGRNQDLSQGYITYSIKARSGLANNTAVHNTSYIYFDFNPPVQTNTTLNTLVYTLPQGINDKKPFSEHKLTIYPNPTNGQIRIFNPYGSKPLTLSIFNALGQEIFRSEAAEKETVVMLPSAGLYLIKGYNDEYEWTGKIIVVY